MLRSFRYEEIADDLRRQIQQGAYPAEKRLPSERVLMQQYGVQRNTIRQALTLLQNEGLLIARARSGIYAQPTAAQAVSPSMSLTLAGPLEGVVLVINAWNHTSNAVDRLLVGLADVLRTTHLSIQRFNSLPRQGEWVHVLPSPDYLKANRVVGAILWAQSSTDLTKLTELRTNVPLVLVDRRVLGFEADCVRFDDRSGGCAITEHLIAQGHREIGFLAEEAFAETVLQRWRGYTIALEKAGIPYDGSRVSLFAGMPEARFADYVRLLLAGTTSPLTAVVCANDSMALRLLRFLRNNGYRVPDDVAVTGYGNLLPDYMDTLDLTTMEQPFEEAGRVAGKVLLERLQGRGDTVADTGFRQIELPVHLIERNSSGRVVTVAG